MDKGIKIDPVTYQKLKDEKKRTDIPIVKLIKRLVEKGIK